MAGKPKMKCNHGHSLTDDNVIYSIRLDGRTQRQCKQCHVSKSKRASRKAKLRRMKARGECKRGHDMWAHDYNAAECWECAYDLKFARTMLNERRLAEYHAAIAASRVNQRSALSDG